MENMPFITILISIMIIVDNVDSFHHYHRQQTCSRTRYRTLDGSCNNLQHPTWGRAKTTERRLKDANGRPMEAYEDGRGVPRGYPHHLPDARLVSNLISDSALGPDDQFDNIRSGEVMGFGQILAHDLIETQIPSGFDCCKKRDSHYGSIHACFPLHIPRGDRRFTPGCNSFRRSTAVLGHRREQRNLVTSYIDASFLYGSSKELNKKLRKPNSFLMLVDTYNLLPTVHGGGGCQMFQKTDRCPITGDERSAEAPQLSLNHLLFVRQHNRVAIRLHNVNPHWNNEKVFQETRRIIIAQLQHIVYNHYLPLIVGNSTMARLELLSKRPGFDDVYDSKVDASIVNSFGAAAWRFGHSLIMPDISELEKDFKTIKLHTLENNLESPHLWQQQGGRTVKGITRWLAAKPAQKIDNFLIDGLRNKLFFLSQPPGFDLFSLNIQRGRDQGVPAYNDWREFCNLKRFASFYEFGEFASRLARIYRSVNDVDLYIGALLEKGENGGVGPTFACIIGIQFHRLKVGDRFWYESSDRTSGLTEEQIYAIKYSTLFSKLWCNNFEHKRIQRDIFRLPSRTNRLCSCEDLPELDLDLWREERDKK
ncbi:PXDN [Mytilus coruscus]|uniref:PXDN n=1 Tax=Mytilus coruscus TaxID=42192 RepID=A0A6J8BCH3_MYTCO|nr:PXDN [Mytilus coruscus]